MLYPYTKVVHISDVVGRGVVATRPIPKGTVVWVRCGADREFDPADLDELTPLEREDLLTYCYRTAAGKFFHCGDDTRFINHSFNANCYLTPYGFEIAVRDIAKGEQLTNDYGFFNILEPFEAEYEGTERTTIYPDDLKRYHEEWDGRILEALMLFFSVPQPLEEFIPAETRAACAAIAEGRAVPASVLNISYF